MLKKFFRANKGFTLVELLVAITILGIASAAVIHAFVTSAGITTRSRVFGEATAGADNVAEVIDAFPKDSFVSGLETVAGMLGVNQSDMYKINDNQVAIKNIHSGSSDFDAIVSYSDGDATAEGDEAGIYELNNYEIAQYTAMDGSFTQSWQDEQNPDVKSENEFYKAAEHPAEIDSENEDRPMFKAKNRLISVNVYTDTSNRIYMDVIYNYTFTYSQYVFNQGVQVYNLKPDGTEDLDNPKTQNAQYVYTWKSRVTFNQEDPTCYSTSEEGASAEPTVFLMYYPYYNNLDASTRLGPKYGTMYPRYAQYEIDTEKTNMTASYTNLASPSVQRDYNVDNTLKQMDLIIINNLGNVPTKFFVVKQRLVRGGEPVSDEYLTTNRCEHVSNKSCIIERITDASLLLNKNANQVFTNAGVNLTTQALIGSVAFRGYKWVNNSGIYVSGNYLNQASEKDFVKKDLVNMEPDSRYYLITIDVYNSGTLDPQEIAPENPDDETLYTVTTESSPVYTFNGSKLD